MEKDKKGGLAEFDGLNKTTIEAYGKPSVEKGETTTTEDGTPYLLSFQKSTCST